MRDVGRVLGWSYTDADRLAKMIPNELNITLSAAAEKNSELRTALENEPATRQLWDHALVLEGLSRNTGIHAAGVVIGDRPLDEYIPLCRGKDNEVITQYEMNALTELGMLKMDFLGLKTLTVLEETVQRIRERIQGSTSRQSLSTTRLLSMFTTAARRSESSRWRAAASPVAADASMCGASRTSLPSELSIGRADEVHRRLHRPQEGAEDASNMLIHFSSRSAPKPTESWFIRNRCSAQPTCLPGIRWVRPIFLRRAMGKKDKEKMAKERSRFVKGCARVNGIAEATANAIFDFIARFAEYGFNKSHSAAYGWVSYQTAYLKAHYPVEFMAALLTHDASTTDRMAEIIAECSRMGLKILAPDVNSSSLHFTPERSVKGMAIRFGLASIKNVGAGAMRSVIEEREKSGLFRSLEDFCARLDARTVNRKILESLVKCGAFDCFGKSRAAAVCGFGSGDVARRGSSARSSEWTGSIVRRTARHPPADGSAGHS